ncbi:hypothetical protein CLAIMM_05862 isoform 1 [Cladophialophora immunda]|nr:hypothetical protein CLAIMM_05862 isoform 1 [Cladophialophora immunda]
MTDRQTAFPITACLLCSNINTPNLVGTRDEPSAAPDHLHRTPLGLVQVDTNGAVIPRRQLPSAGSTSQDASASRAHSYPVERHLSLGRFWGLILQATFGTFGSPLGSDH